MVRSVFKNGDTNCSVRIANGWTLNLTINNEGEYEGKGLVENKDGKVMFEGEWKKSAIKFGSPLYFIFWAAWFVRYPLWYMLVVSSILFSMCSLLSKAHNRLSHMQVSNSTLFSRQPGAQYSGQLSYFRRHGQGVMIYENFSMYNGSWSHGVMSGPGTLTFSQDCDCDQWGDVLSGDWVENRLTHGNYSYNTGDVYTGDLANYERHGAGIMRYVDGSVYEGQFNHDFREGHGTLLETDGWACEGGWHNDEQHGLGECRFGNDTETFPVVWQVGKVVLGGKPTTASVPQAPKSEPNKPNEPESVVLIVRDHFVSFLDALVAVLSKKYMISLANILNLMLWPIAVCSFVMFLMSATLMV